MADTPLIVVGAGIGGLATAVVLAARGHAVQVIERDPQPGGKLRPVELGGRLLDAGPTVMTMRDVFDGLFALAGERLDDHVQLRPLHTLARHAWPDGSRLDLLADPAATVQAIGDFAGAQAARQYAAFCQRTRQVYQALNQPYLRSTRPNPLSLTWHCASHGTLPGLVRGTPMMSLWRSLGRQFSDARLRQLFARYATYGGSSPLAAPATLMLIAHVEQAGVWSVQGGMHRLADALAALAQRLGVRLRCGSGVRQVLAAKGRVSAVELDSGERLPAQAVVFNGDAAALSAGLLGPAAQHAVRAVPVARRSLSALTWNLLTPTDGFPLARHNVFFSDDYPTEFADQFQHGRLSQTPTVYVCAQDRDHGATPAVGQPERLLCLVNAPARADWQPLSEEEIAACEDRTFNHLARLGLQVQMSGQARLRHSPADWAARFPATGGALYGQATHGWRSSFNRPSAATRLPGLYLAGGSTHPGAGVPMAVLSGLRAAERCLADLPGPISTVPWRPAVMPGGTSTP